MKVAAVKAPPARSAAATRPATIQRFADTALRASAADLPKLVARAMAGTSSKLDPGVRQFMEPRFGHDFSQVRVHADASSASAAHALNARAFTSGDHVFFGAGQYAPSSARGRHILAHELAHVVQQRSAAVDGSEGPGGFRLSDPGDRFERAAEARAREVTAGSRRSLATPPARARGGAVAGPRPGAIQRFLAGEAGHGGIEEESLQEAGFSKEEAHETYFGNWLRDFSQLLDTEGKGGVSEAVKRELINVLATGMFGHAPSDAELGRYLASEHADRPTGGESAENDDPKLSAEHRDRRRAKLSKSQQRWFGDEQSADVRKKIAAASAASGLPAYIERAKEHAKRQIAEAAKLGRTPAGERALGDGLHVVEDYFAHSNFVEVALAQLVAGHRVAADNPAVIAMGQYDQVDPAHVGLDSKGRPAIVTGTSTKGPGDTVGLMEALKAEFQNSQLSAAFLRGAAIRYGWRPAVAGGRAALGIVGGVVGGAVGAVGGAVGGLFSGAAKGAAAGWHGARHWWSKPFAALTGLVGGAFSGLGRGAVAGAQSGWRLGSKVGGAAGEVVGKVVGAPAALAAAALAFAVSLIGRGGAALVYPERQETIAEKTHETVDPSGKLSPSHSQIAKDDIDHPLHEAAARLAHDADIAIGRTMIDVWAGRKPASDAQALVDTYLAHPADTVWWRETLEKAVSTGDRPKD